MGQENPAENQRELRFGIVGTGLIADVLARSIERADNARLSAVSSRRQETADAFIADRPDVAAGAVAVEGVDALLAREDVDAVYVATPTSAKEEIALAAIDAGKHVLVDKPFTSADSAQRMIEAASARGVLFMDATHFVHHPRTIAIRSRLPELLGRPRSLHTAFYFPFSDRDNIRFDVEAEPMGAHGDMAWYSMRAIVEYLRPEGAVTGVAVHAERDEATGAVVRTSGLVQFAGGQSSTFDVGYTAGTVLMDLSLLGTDGVVSMDDFVLDWHESFAFQNEALAAGFTHRAGMATRGEFSFHGTPSHKPGDVLMVERFAELTADPAAGAAHGQATIETQQLLDQTWAAIADG